MPVPQLPVPPRNPCFSIPCLPAPPPLACRTARSWGARPRGWWRGWRSGWMWWPCACRWVARCSTWRRRSCATRRSTAAPRTPSTLRVRRLGVGWAGLVVVVVVAGLGGTQMLGLQRAGPRDHLLGKRKNGWRRCCMPLPARPAGMAAANIVRGDALYTSWVRRHPPGPATCLPCLRSARRLWLCFALGVPATQPLCPTQQGPSCVCVCRRRWIGRVWWATRALR